MKFLRLGGAGHVGSFVTPYLRSKHDLRVLGQPVERGHGARRQVVGRRDRPQRLAGLHGVPDGCACRRGCNEKDDRGGEEK